MFALAGAEQRMGSSRLNHKDPVTGNGQLTPNHRQQVVHGRSWRAAAGALPPSSTSHHAIGHVRRHSVQQLQDHSLLQQHCQHAAEPSPATLVQQLPQHRDVGHDTAAAASPTSAFYTPPAGQHSSSMPSLGHAPSTVLLPTDPLPAHTAAGSVHLPATSSRPSDISSSSGNGVASSSSQDSSSSSSPPTSSQGGSLAAQHAAQQQQQPRSKGPKHKTSGRKAAAGSCSTTTSSSSKKKKRPRQPGNTNSSSSSSGGSSDDLAASKKLTSALSHAGCWQDLATLLQQHGSSMNHIHASALLTTTSKLVQYHKLGDQQQQEFGSFYVDALQLAYTQARGAQARPRELSSMLWAVAKVGLHPGVDWLGAYLAAVQPQLQAMTVQDVGLLLWALARFGLIPESSFCAELLAATQQQFASAACSSSSGTSSRTGSSSSSSSSSGKGRQRGFDSQGLCNILWGLAVLGLNPGTPWLTAAADAAGQLLQQGQFVPQGIAVMTWALAKVGYRPGQQWLHAVAATATQQMYAFKPAELSMLCHALARLHYDPQQALASSMQDVQQEQQQPAAGVDDAPSDPQQAATQQQQGQVHGPQKQPQQQQQQQESFLAELQRVSWPQLQCLHFSEAANLVWALGVMQQQPAPGWVDSAVAQLQATLHEADAKALASACYGLAKLQHKQLAGSWWQAVWQRVPDLLGPPAAAAAAVGSGQSWQSNNTSSSDGSGSSDGSSSSSGCSEGENGSLRALSQSQGTFLWAAAKLKAKPPAAVAEGLFAASQQLLQQQAVNGAELMAVTTAAAVLQLVPPNSWLQAVDEAFTVLLLRTCDCEQLSAAGLREQHQQQQQQQEEKGDADDAAAQQQVLQCLSLLQQQQHDLMSAAPLAQSASAAAAAVPTLSLPPLTAKEVSNITFSLGRLRHVPSAALLSALERFVHQQQHTFLPADWLHLRRPLQSWHGQLTHSSKAAGAAAADDEVAAGCAVGDDSPEPTAGACSGAVDTPPDSGSSGALLQQQGISEQYAAALGVGTFTGGQQALCWHQQQPHQQQQQQLEGVDEGLIQTSSAVMAPGELQGEEMLVYGSYLQLPLRSVNGSSNSAVCVSGFASPGAGSAGSSGGVTAQRGRHKAQSSLQHQGVAVMGGLSVAAG